MYSTPRDCCLVQRTYTQKAQKATQQPSPPGIFQRSLTSGSRKGSLVSLVNLMMESMACDAGMMSRVKTSSSRSFASCDGGTVRYNSARETHKYTQARWNGLRVSGSIFGETAARLAPAHLGARPLRRQKTTQPDHPAQQQRGRSQTTIGRSERKKAQRCARSAGPSQTPYITPMHDSELCVLTSASSCLQKGKLVSERTPCTHGTRTAYASCCWDICNWPLW